MQPPPDHLLFALEVIAIELVIGAVFVLWLGPRKMNAHTDQAWTHIVPSLRVEVEQVVRNVLGGAQPSPEAQAAAQEALGAAVSQAVEAAIGNAVKGRMGALSASGVDARAERKSAEAALRQAVLAHPKGGLPALLGLSTMKKVDPDTFHAVAEAAAFSPESVSQFLDEHGDKLRLGFGKKDEVKPKVQVI